MSDFVVGEVVKVTVIAGERVFYGTVVDLRPDKDVYGNTIPAEIFDKLSHSTLVHQFGKSHDSHCCTSWLSHSSMEEYAEAVAERFELV